MWQKLQRRLMIKFDVAIAASALVIIIFFTIQPINGEDGKKDFDDDKNAKNWKKGSNSLVVEYDVRQPDNLAEKKTWIFWCISYISIYISGYSCILCYIIENLYITLAHVATSLEKHTIWYIGIFVFWNITLAHLSTPLKF